MKKVRRFDRLEALRSGVCTNTAPLSSYPTSAAFVSSRCFHVQLVVAHQPWMDILDLKWRGKVRRYGAISDLPIPTILNVYERGESQWINVFVQEKFQKTK